MYHSCRRGNDTTGAAFTRRMGWGEIVPCTHWVFRSEAFRPNSSSILHHTHTRTHLNLGLAPGLAPERCTRKNSYLLTQLLTTEYPYPLPSQFLLHDPNPCKKREKESKRAVVSCVVWFPFPTQNNAGNPIMSRPEKGKMRCVSVPTRCVRAYTTATRWFLLLIK